MKILPRRRVLRGLGGVAIGLPLLEAMLPRRAHAAPAPRRLVVVFSPNGTNDPGQFHPRTEGAAFELGKEVQPLAPLRQHLLFLTGVNMQSAVGIGQDQVDLHGVGMAHMPTSTKMLRAEGFRSVAGLPNVFAGGPSIDQEIARRIGAATRFPSLELAVQATTDLGAHPFTRMSYKDRAQPVPAEENPRAAFTRLFTDGTAGAGVNLAQAQAERRSVLDFVMDDYARLAPSLGAQDRRKLDAHLGALRSLEKRIAQAPTTGGVCKGPAAPATPHTELSAG